MTKNVIVIAEIGSVHDGSFGNACKLIDLAASCGAKIVKFQTHIAEAESLPNAPSPAYFNEESRMDYFRRTAFSEEQYKKMIERAKSKNVEFLSSPFSLEAVDLLERVGVSSYKVPSGEVTNLPLLERLADTKKPVYLSSGMSDWKELDIAVDILKKGGPLCVMQCSSEYPCRAENVGLNVILEMKKRYDLPIGFSDHTLDFAASLGAVAFGATVIEKHLTFSKSMYGSDAKHSMEPEDFRRFCQSIAELDVILKNPVDKSDCSGYSSMKKTFEKSVVSAVNLRAGDELSMKNIAFKKPGDGIRAFEYKKVLGKKIKKDIPANVQIYWEDLV